MPAAGVFELGAGLDQRAVVYGARFCDASGAWAAGGRFCFAAEVVLQTGRAPSYALVEVPLAAWHERVPAVAGVRGGPAAGLKVGTRARVYAHADGRAWTLLTGSVVALRQDLDADGVTATVFDDRWLLEGVPVAGQLGWDPVTQTVTYRQREACRFNPRGRPNCLDAPGGPLFAPAAGYGRQAGDADPAPGQARTRARPWRHADIAAYLRRAYATDDFAPLTAGLPWFTRVDAGKLALPMTFGAELLADAAYDPQDARAAAGHGEPDREGADGRAPDLALEGLDLLTALSRTAESAGAYALHVQPTGEGTAAALTFVPARYVEGAAAGVTPARPGAGGIASAAALGVAGGGLEEDGSRAYTAATTAGAPVALERRLAFVLAGGQGLERAWNAEDETAFKQYIDAHPTMPRSKQALLEACWKFPRVYAAYQVERDFDLLAGTKFAGEARATAHPPALPELLTTAALGAQREVPLPVAVELKDNAGQYRARTMLDGLQVDADGTIWLPGLREAGLGGDEQGTWKGSPGAPLSLAARELRLTVALALDRRLTEGLALPAAGLGLAAADPNGCAGRFANGLARTYWVDAGAAYREDLRKDAWPVPQSVSGSVQASDRATAGAELRSDAARARAHVQRRLAEVARTEKTGRLVFERPALWQPGTAIAGLAAAGAGVCAVRGIVWRVRHDYRRQRTELELI